MVTFSQAPARICAHVDCDLSLRGLPRAKVVATPLNPPPTAAPAYATAHKLLLPYRGSLIARPGSRPPSL